MAGALAYIPISFAQTEAADLSEYTVTETRQDGATVYLHNDGRTHAIKYADGRIEKQRFNKTPYSVYHPEGRTVYYDEQGGVAGETFDDGGEKHYGADGEITREIRKEKGVTEQILFEEGVPVSIERSDTTETVEIYKGKGNTRTLVDAKRELRAVLTEEGVVIEVQQEFEDLTYLFTYNEATNETLEKYLKEGEEYYARGKRAGEKIKTGSFIRGIIVFFKRKFAPQEAVAPEDITKTYATLLTE